VFAALVRKHRSLRQTAGAVVASSSGTAALCGAAAVPCSGDSRLSRRGRQGRAARRGAPSRWSSSLARTRWARHWL